jgi:DNA-binding NarL/FixJ family response regulator
MIITYTKDLIFKSKLKGIVTITDHIFVKDLSSMNHKLEEGQCSLLMIDLSLASPELFKNLSDLRIANPSMRILAFASHLDQENINAAVKLGVEVMYRSQFVNEIEQILGQL